MTQAKDHHLPDQLLSALVDEPATSDESSQAKAHLATCPACSARLEEFAALVGLLKGLPSLEPPQDFSLSLRPVLEPPNLVRLRRWYGVARAGAATLAAAFVFLTASALYVDSHAGSSSLSSAPQLVSAPAAGQDASPASRALVPAAAAASTPTSGPPAPVGAPSRPGGPAAQISGAAGGSSEAAPAAAAAARPRSAPGEEVTDQVSAATSVRPLPTPFPSIGPIFTQAPQPVAREPLPAAAVDPAASLRTAAAVAGLLAIFGVAATLIVRQRLKTSSISRTE